MDAEIRKLTYVTRPGGVKPESGLLGGAGISFGELPPFLRQGDVAKQPSKITDVRWEARLIELEREREEDERRYREALAAAREKAAGELAAALHEQQERLSREYVASVQAAIADFHHKQEQYFATAEAAVVRLALSIAARVLHREAQLDPLLLRGTVRVALEDAQQSATCVLEISATGIEAWREWLAGAGMQVRVQLRGREDVQPGHCRLEIGASSADLSVQAQLTEIERGFFDLLQSRPSIIDNEAKSDR
jgi:flagellar assembly protein FliH